MTGGFVQPPFWAYERGGMRGWPVHQGLSRTSPPATDPIDLAAAKAQLRNVDGMEDELILSYLQAACGYFEGRSGRALITQSWDLTLDAFPWKGQPITVPKPPLQTVVGITYVDASGVLQTLDPSLYVVDAPQGPYAAPGRIGVAYGTWYWPFPPAQRVINGVTIQFVAGYGDATAVPPETALCLKLLTGLWWKNREAGTIIRASADVLPYGVESLVQPFLLESLA